MFICETADDRDDAILDGAKATVDPVANTETSSDKSFIFKFNLN
jgi:hypothetical protein